MVPDRIEREVVIDTPLERVWSVITEAEHVGRWFGDAGAYIELTPGGRFTCSWAKHGTVHGRVERVERPRLFAFRWARRMNVDMTPGNSTLVELTLTPEGSGTRLRIVESGFSTLDATDEERRTYRDGNVEGWAMETADLTNYLARQVA